MSEKSEIIIGGLYEHYKGGQYRVTDLAIYEQTEEPVVVYEMLYDTPDYPKGTKWVRSESAFSEDIEHGGMVVPRFKQIES